MFRQPLKPVPLRDLALVPNLIEHLLTQFLRPEACTLYYIFIRMLCGSSFGGSSGLTQRLWTLTTLLLDCSTTLLHLYFI